MTTFLNNVSAQITASDETAETFFGQLDIWPAGTLVLDAAGVVVVSNRAFRDAIACQHIDGEGLSNFVHRDDRAIRTNSWRQVAVEADTISNLAGELASKITFLEIDVEDAESAIGSRVSSLFDHPRSTVTL